VKAGTAGSGPDTDARVRRLWLFAIHAVAVGAIALLVSHVVLNAQNDLHRNGRWSSAKVQLDKGVIGAVATMVSRVPLYRNRLDLGAYSGYQQLLLEDLPPVERFGFEFRADPATYLDVLFGSKPARLSGIRLSQHPDFRDLGFVVAESGEFIESVSLDLSNRLKPGDWNRVQLDLGSSSLRIEINGATVSEIPHAAEAVHTVGFRGGMLGPQVDDLRVEFRDPFPPLWESFANRRYWGLMLLLSGLGAGGIALLTHAALRRWSRLDATGLHFACFMGYVIVLTSLGAFAALDYYYLAALYPTGFPAMSVQDYENRIESSDVAMPRIQQRIDSLRDDRRFRILLVGSSQTWGSGARRGRDAWARVLERELERRQATDREGFVVINTGISGTWASRLLDAYERDWLRAGPDLVVINLGNNDTEARDFASALRRFVAVNRKAGVRTVFMLEPNSGEQPFHPSLQRNHRIMARVAKKLDVEVIDLRAYLWDLRESGFLWWDFVHLTSYGQRLVGVRVAHELEPLLPRSGAAASIQEPAP